MAVKILPPKTLMANPDGFAAVGAGTLPIACDPLEEVHDDDVSYAGRGSGGGTATLGFQHDLGFSGRFSSITSVKVIARSRRTDGADHTHNLKILLGGASSTSGAFTLTSGYATREYDVTAARPGGGNWSEDDFRDPTIQFQDILAANPPTSRHTSMYLKFEGTPATVAIEQHRLVASQKLLARLKQVFVTVGLPLRFMDLDLLEDFVLSDPRFPSWDGSGRGLERWQRLLLRALRADVDPMTNLVHVTAFDLRKYLTLFWDVGQSKISTRRTDIADGIARLSTGGTRVFTRASMAYGAGVSGVAVTQFGVDEEAIAKEGMLLERASTTRVWNSAFDLGHTNWTLLNHGVDSATVTLDTAALLFEPTPEITTRRSTRILTGASTQAGLEQVTNATIGASSKNTLSAWHDDDAGGQLAIRVKNETTGNWLQSNGTWSGSEADAITFANRPAKTRDYLHFTMEGTGSTLRLRAIGVNTGAKVSHVYHLQLESGPPSSEIVSGSADKTRAVSRLKVSNNFRKRVLWTAHGYLVCEVVPHFNDAELASGEEKMIARAAYDGSNIDEFLYKQGTGFAMRRTASGTPTTASKATTAARGTTYRVAIRWSGTEGELGLSDYTGAVFVDGVKGTEAVIGPPPVPPSTMDVWLGQDGSDAKTLDAALRHLKTGPFVPTDAEMARMV